MSVLFASEEGYNQNSPEVYSVFANFPLDHLMVNRKLSKIGKMKSYFLFCFCF